MFLKRSNKNCLRYSKKKIILKFTFSSLFRGGTGQVPHLVPKGGLRNDLPGGPTAAAATKL